MCRKLTKRVSRENVKRERYHVPPRIRRNLGRFPQKQHFHKTPVTMQQTSKPSHWGLSQIKYGLDNEHTLTLLIPLDRENRILQSEEFSPVQFMPIVSSSTKAMSTVTGSKLLGTIALLERIRSDPESVNRQLELVHQGYGTKVRLFKRENGDTKTPTINKSYGSIGDYKVEKIESLLRHFRSGCSCCSVKKRIENTLETVAKTKDAPVAINNILQLTWCDKEGELIESFQRVFLFAIDSAKICQTLLKLLPTDMKIPSVNSSKSISPTSSEGEEEEEENPENSDDNDDAEHSETDSNPSNPQEEEEREKSPTTLLVPDIESPSTLFQSREDLDSLVDTDSKYQLKDELLKLEEQGRILQEQSDLQIKKLEAHKGTIKVLKGLDCENDRLKRKLESLETEFTEFKTASLEIQQGLSLHIESLATQKEDLLAQVKENTEQIASLREKLNESEALGKVTAANIIDLKEKLRGVTGKYNTAQESLDQTLSTLAQAEHDISVLYAQNKLYKDIGVQAWTEGQGVEKDFPLRPNFKIPPIPKLTSTTTTTTEDGPPQKRVRWNPSLVEYQNKS